jgi:hypothetical protein
MAATCLTGLDPASYQSHALHDSRRNWPETNCYVDLWVELLNSLGHNPTAALGFAVTQDFEGDQFTFFKFPAEDLAALYGVSVQELAIYDTVEAHTIEQLQRGRPVLVEVDSYFLPDTQGTSYRTTHGKTTIAINHLDSERCALHYFHNAGYFALSGADFNGIFRAEPNEAAVALFPYVEFVKLGASPVSDSLPQVAITLLKKHLRLRPSGNPLRAYQQAFATHAAKLTIRPMEFFHLYAFNTSRQFGANFELLMSHLEWLRGQGESGLDVAIQGCERIASGAKSLQFQLARAVAKHRFEALENALSSMADAYDLTLDTLHERYCK